MKPAPFEYVRPASMAEAIEALASDEGAKVIAGGQSLVPLMAMRLARPTLLVDVADIGLGRIERQGDILGISADMTHARLEHDPVVAEHVPIVREAAGLIGYPAIRSRGTIGGSLAHADPVGELPALLVAVGGSVVVRGVAGVRGSRPAISSRVFSRRRSRTTRSSRRSVSRSRDPGTGRRSANGRRGKATLRSRGSR